MCCWERPDGATIGLGEISHHRVTESVNVKNPGLGRDVLNDFLELLFGWPWLGEVTIGTS